MCPSQGTLGGGRHVQQETVGSSKVEKATDNRLIAVFMQSMYHIV